MKGYPLTLILTVGKSRHHQWRSARNTTSSSCSCCGFLFLPHTHTLSIFASWDSILLCMYSGRYSMSSASVSDWVCPECVGSLLYSWYINLSFVLCFPSTCFYCFPSTSIIGFMCSFSALIVINRFSSLTSFCNLSSLHLHPFSVKTKWRNILRTSLLSKQVLRHAMATTALQAGCDVATVSKTLGHSSVATTSFYLHAHENGACGFLWF